MRTKARRSERGSSNVEYLVVLVALVIPLGLVLASVARYLVPYFGVVEELTGAPLP